MATWSLHWGFPAPPSTSVSAHHPDQYKGVFGPGVDPYLAEIERTIAAARGAQLEAGLRALQSRHPLIGDVRGCGLIMGFELVRDHITKMPATEAAEHVQDALRAAGYICVRGTPGRNVFRVNPPLCIRAADIAGLLEALDNALASAQRQYGTT